MEELRHIPVTELVETTFPLRPVRKISVEYRELVDSVAMEGILQPLLVRPRGDKYEVVEGSYRREAALECKLSKVPCLIRDMTDEQVLSIQLQANAIRPTTRRAEFAERIHHIMEEKKLTLPQLAAMFHKSPVWLRGVLSLRKLGAEAREMVNKGELGVQVGMMLARLPMKMQSDFLYKAVTLPTAEFMEQARDALKNFREYVKTGRTEMNITRMAEPMPFLRQMKELRHEAATCEKAGAVITAMEGTTPIDGWRACLAWVLHLDPESVMQQFEKQERAQHEKLSAEQRRKADRLLRKQLISLKDFKNEQ